MSQKILSETAKSIISKHINRETDKHINIQQLTHISRSGDRPQEIPGIPEVLLAGSANTSGKVPGGFSKRSAKNFSAEEKRKFVQDRMREQAKYLYDYPEQMFYLSVSVYHYLPSKPTRLTVNLDFIQQSGTTVFKACANCVSRSRKRELLNNVKYPDWAGYQLALSEVSSKPEGHVFVGKIKNRARNKSLIQRILIPNTVVIVNPDLSNNTVDVEIIINDVSYRVNCASIQNNYFSHKGEYQDMQEEMYEF